MDLPTTAVTSVLYSLARVGVGSRVTGDVEQILGRPATDIQRFVIDNQDAWSAAAAAPE